MTIQLIAIIIAVIALAVLAYVRLGTSYRLPEVPPKMRIVVYVIVACVLVALVLSAFFVKQLPR